MNYENLTPAMKQYVDLKKQYSDCVLFFRLGDFYETFWEDAHICSKTLDIVLTSKNKNSENPIPMAGIPYHSADKYIQKLIGRGYKVAIAEQTSQPVPGKIVEREVVSIMSPGTYTAESDAEFKFILALTEQETVTGVFYHMIRGDLSAGQFYTYSLEDFALVLKHISIVKPVEVIVDIDVKLNFKEQLQHHLQIVLPHVLVTIGHRASQEENFVKSILQVSSLDSFGKALENGRIHACSLLFQYLSRTQKGALHKISGLQFFGGEDRLYFDDVTLKNLEIFESSYEHTVRHSLLGVFDKCVTTGGKRLFRETLKMPIKNLSTLIKRQHFISFFIENPQLTEDLTLVLKECFDIQRVVSSLLYRKISALQFQKLKTTFFHLFTKNDELSVEKLLLMIGFSSDDARVIKDLAKKLDETLTEVIVSDEMNYIADGYSSEIDELKKMVYHSDSLLLEYQQDLVKYTGVQNIKLKYIVHQGYYLELTKKDAEDFERKAQRDHEKYDFMRIGTLKSGEKYSTPFLASIQKKIIESKDKLIDAEKLVLVSLVSLLNQYLPVLNELCFYLGWLDIYSSQALLSLSKGFVKPEIKQGAELLIEDGRHPVVEAFLDKHTHFVANNLLMNEQSYLHVITGPNMGGKSTYLRQNALIVLLAHCGFFVPARKAIIPLVDGIFARIGSADNIAKNQSTFMTEMIEVSSIIHNATANSFVILDELGRGTSTYDGLAITKAIVSYISHSIKAKTLIATHYHELIGLQGELAGLENFSVGVYETEKEVVFMKKIVAGGASKSYGIDVAKLAGLPDGVIQQAKEYLLGLEQKKNNSFQAQSLFASPLIAEDKNSLIYKEIAEIVKSADINQMSPLQSFQFLISLKEKLK
ncbi:MAG TPA: DNA mismatch repair protein MutS [Candidatus Absconditabacterales bacterium]|nr:DNA mismatch repair protein MutS [Candidatus Absconditabacterales bacterium]